MPSPTVLAMISSLGGSIDFEDRLFPSIEEDSIMWREKIEIDIKRVSDQLLIIDGYSLNQCPEFQQIFAHCQGSGGSSLPGEEEIQAFLELFRSQELLPWFQAAERVHLGIHWVGGGDLQIYQTYSDRLLNLLSAHCSQYEWWLPAISTTWTDLYEAAATGEVDRVQDLLLTANHPFHQKIFVFAERLMISLYGIPSDQALSIADPSLLALFEGTIVAKQDRLDTHIEQLLQTLQKNIVSNEAKLLISQPREVQQALHRLLTQFSPPLN